MTQLGLFDNPRNNGTPFKPAREKYSKAILNDGGRCPACERFGKVYDRTITSSMAAALLLLCRDTEIGEFVRVSEFFKKRKAVVAVLGGDIAKLRYWGLLEKKDKSSKKGDKSAGWWRVPLFGRYCATSGIRIPKKARIYDERLLAFSGGYTSVVDSLRKKFDYRAIMKRTAPVNSKIHRDFSTEEHEALGPGPNLLTVEEAHKIVMDGRMEGIQCPLCDRLALVNHESFTGTMARVLTMMCKEYKNDWLYMPTLQKKYDFAWDAKIALTRYWGLSEMKPGERDDSSNRVGYYRPLKAGFDFINREKKIPKYALMYNAECLDFEGDMVSVDDVLSSGYDGGKR